MLALQRFQHLTAHDVDIGICWEKPPGVNPLIKVVVKPKPTTLPLELL
jgi:hypothetical protein